MKSLGGSSGVSPVVSVRLSEAERSRYARVAKNGNVSGFIRASAAYLWTDWMHCRRSISTYFKTYSPISDVQSGGSRSLVDVDWNWVAPRLLSSIVTGELSNIACIPARNRDWVWCGWIRPEKTVACVLWGVMPRGGGDHLTFADSAIVRLGMVSQWSARASFVRELWTRIPSQQWHKVGSNAAP